MRKLFFRRIFYWVLALTVSLLPALVFYTTAAADGDPLWQPSEGAELIGRPAPALSGLTWLNSGPLGLEDLRGKVVLIRFWLVGCPYCKNTAPALAELYEKYGGDGLVVIGIHHPKSERARDDAFVLKAAKGLGFEFPVAQDRDWKVINAYWLGGVRRSYTSSSILIDKKGIIRFVHDGGEFYRSEDNTDADLAYKTIDAKIRELLAED
jgi:peroxiredoxin